jgi:hypothetical protein
MSMHFEITSPFLASADRRRLIGSASLPMAAIGAMS